MLSEHNLHLSLFLIQYVLFLFTLFGSFAGTVCYVLFNFLCLVLNDIQVVFRLRLEWTRWSFSAWKCWLFRRFRSYWKAFESPSHTLPVSSKTKYIERKKRKKYASNAFPYVRSSVFITWNMFTFLYKKKGFILLAEDIIIIAGGTSAIFVIRSNRENGLGEQSLYSTQDIVYVRML